MVNLNDIYGFTEAFPPPEEYICTGNNCDVDKCTSKTVTTNSSDESVAVIQTDSPPNMSTGYTFIKP